MQMARKVGVKIICRIVVTKSFFSPQTRMLVKIKPFNPTSPIFNLSHSFPSLTPTHCIHIVNVDISETKWSASKVWDYTHSQPRPRLTSPDPPPSLILSHRHILELSTRQPQLPASTSDSDSLGPKSQFIICL